MIESEENSMDYANGNSKRRDLFVFAGQSNMMGASVYPPKKTICVEHSYEYKHKPRRLGHSKGAFVLAGYPAGEFSYVDMKRAYAPDLVNERGESRLTDYQKNTFFCPAMSSLASNEDKTEHPFSTFSEATIQKGATLAPILAEEWEKLGYACAYAHIAKGAIPIAHYLTDDMALEYRKRMTEYNRSHNTCFEETMPMERRMPGAADYFFEKCKDFFVDAEKTFSEDKLSAKCFFWLQGEGDAGCSAVEYEFQLDVLWDALKSIGFTHFFCIRVDYFGKPEIDRIMEAQERFTKKHPDAYMLTRAASYFPYAGREESDWFVAPPAEEYHNCRDSFYGYENQHINEKGFCVIARHGVKNLCRILIDDKEPCVEPENITSLKKNKRNRENPKTKKEVAMNKDYIFPSDCKAIIDVTKPPYNVDNTGKKDCTQQLCKLIDEVLGAYEKNFYDTKKKLESMKDENALISFEIRKVNGKSNVIFPEILPPSKIIYFPNGTYLVSDTLSYSKEEFRNFLGDVRHLEMNCQLRFMGQSRDGVVLKLQDHCKGFEFGNDRPVIDFMRGEQSNIAMTNMLENMTIDIGVGNPGATGVRYFANNTGAIRNVKIVSSDPEGRGHTGLSILHSKVSAGYAKNIEIIGFQYGIRIASQYMNSVFEHIVLKNQKRWGIFVEGNMVAIRDLYSENFVPAIKVDGLTARVILTDARLSGGNPLDVAVRHCFGHLMLRNITASGYGSIVQGRWIRTKIENNCEYLKEAVAGGPMMLFDNENQNSLNLPVKETPEVRWAPLDEWVSVNEFGAVGDGITDDTESIRKAFASGKSTVYFQPGQYLIDDVIEIPATLERIQFMYSDLVSGENIKKRKHTGVFLIQEHSGVPVIIEDLFAWEKFNGFMTLVEHACKRTVIFSDVHTQTASIYFNTFPGAMVFMENTGCTIGGVPGAGHRKEPLPHEDWNSYSRETPCFYFAGQEVYCRQLNPERSLHEVINDGGKLWVLGGKTEEEGTAFETRNGGSTEVLGVTFAIVLGQGRPTIINENSNVSIYASTFNTCMSEYLPIAIRETQGNETRELRHEEVPLCAMGCYMIPLYVGRKKSNEE
ncbi:MAG: hypothetical protein IJA08_00690 [Clostridia bacterium]|nr:hypothetical protein [Clostridia bacterium]